MKEANSFNHQDVSHSYFIQNNAKSNAILLLSTKYEGITCIFLQVNTYVQAHGFTTLPLKYIGASCISCKMYELLRQQITDFIMRVCFIVFGINTYLMKSLSNQCQIYVDSTKEIVLQI